MASFDDLEFVTDRHRRKPPNVVIWIVDDWANDQLSVYDDVNRYTQPNPYGPHPVIDWMTQRGVRYTRCYGAPVCSPTRFGILSGRHAFRTGMADISRQAPAAVAGPTSQNVPNIVPPLTELLLPEILTAFQANIQSGAFGKWHIGNSTIALGGDYRTTPNDMGFGHFAGTIFNPSQEPKPPGAPAGGSHSNWFRVVNGVENTELTYAPSTNIDDLIDWWNNIAGPQASKFAWFASTTVHLPSDYPPAALHSFGAAVPPVDHVNTRGRAAFEATCTEFQRFLEAMPPAELQNTMIVFMGDNGTGGEWGNIPVGEPNYPVGYTGPVPAGVTATDQLTVAPYNPAQWKATPFEPGIKFPLIICGPYVQNPGRRFDGLVQSLDLFDTVLEWFGADKRLVIPDDRIIDSNSLTGTLTDARTTTFRPYIFSEFARPNELPLGSNFQNTGRNILRRALTRADGFKLIQDSAFEDGVYDLNTDPGEAVNLGLGHPQYASLRKLFDDLLATYQGPLPDFGA